METKKLEGVSWVYVLCVNVYKHKIRYHSLRQLDGEKLKIYGVVAADELIKSKPNVVRLSEFAWDKDKKFC